MEAGGPEPWKAGNAKRCEPGWSRFTGVDKASWLRKKINYIEEKFFLTDFEFRWKI